MVFDPVEAASTFRDTGVVRVPGAFADAAPDLAATVRRHVLRRFGVDEQDQSTWDRPCHGAISTKKFRHPDRFNAVFSPDVKAVLDEVFGTGQWQRPAAARVLVTPPRSATEWSVPTGFHLDVPIDRPTWPGHGALLFSFLADAPVGAGGTCVMPGSHRLIGSRATVVEHLPVERRLPTILRSNGEWLRQIVNEDDCRPDRGDRYRTETRVGDVPLTVQELTGAAGDVVITHLYTLHAISPNTSTSLRLMLSTGVGVAA